MKLFCKSIFCFVLLPTICFASDKEPSKWAKFPLINKIRTSFTGATDPILKKSLPSCEWPSVDHADAFSSPQDLKASDSPVLVTVPLHDEHVTSAKITRTEFDSTKEKSPTTPAEIIEFSNPLQAPRKLSRDLQVDILIKSFDMTEQRSEKATQLMDVQNNASGNATEYENKMLESYQSMELDRQSQPEFAISTHDSSHDASLFKIFYLICCPCLPHTIEEKPIDSKKKNSR